MSKEIPIAVVQSYVKGCSDNLSENQIVKCSNYIRELCSKYKAKLYSSFDKKIVFRLYDEGKRIRYLSFEFNKKLVTVKYGTKCTSKNIGIYLAF